MHSPLSHPRHGLCRARVWYRHLYTWQMHWATATSLSRPLVQTGSNWFPYCLRIHFAALVRRARHWRPRPARECELRPQLLSSLLQVLRRCSAAPLVSLIAD